MSFHCKACGLVEKGIKQAKVTTRIRKVIYQFRNIYLSKKINEKTGCPIIIESKPEIKKTTKGFEIVEQDIYCVNCEAKKLNPDPAVVGEVIRTIDRKMQKRNR